MFLYYRDVKEGNEMTESELYGLIGHLALKIAELEDEIEILKSPRLVTCEDSGVEFLK